VRGRHATAPGGAGVQPAPPSPAPRSAAAHRPLRCARETLASVARRAGRGPFARGGAARSCGCGWLCACALACARVQRKRPQQRLPYERRSAARRARASSASTPRSQTRLTDFSHLAAPRVALATSRHWRPADRR
jgi:hypothetical protein